MWTAIVDDLLANHTAEQLADLVVWGWLWDFVSLVILVITFIKMVVD